MSLGLSISTLASYDAPRGVEVRGRYDPEYAAILTRDALAFVAALHREFRSHVELALELRLAARARYDAGAAPGFDPATKHVREGEWRCAPPPAAVTDRRVEITGPAERKMVVDALYSGAKVFMADLEDALTPSWEKLMGGQVCLREAVEGVIAAGPGGGGEAAKLFVRPRGWHLLEAHILVDGEPATGCLVDFGLYFFHNHATFRRTQGAGHGPFFYLPKMEHSREARIWRAVFERAEAAAGIQRGSIRATVLIETLPAVFQMEEILHELRDHSLGLNCGRWDYIFSYVKTFRAHRDRLLPDRVVVGMNQHFMRSYSDLLIRTCHRRGVHAMGGMAAQIPIQGDPEANEAAMGLVRKDKLREVRAGHDGTWAAHPDLIPTVSEIFTAHLGAAPNQIETEKREDAAGITAADLLRRPSGARTVEGLRLNTRVGIQYVEAWLGGAGLVPLYNVMEDAATAEISRVQIWQWLRYGAELEGEAGKVRADGEVFRRVVEEEMGRIRREVGRQRWERGRYQEACRIFAGLCSSPAMEDFLTLAAYDRIVKYDPIWSRI